MTEHTTIYVTEEAGIKHGGHFYPTGPHTVPSTMADYFVKHGWATDNDGRTGERKAGNVTLDPEDVTTVIGLS